LSPTRVHPRTRVGLGSDHRLPTWPESRRERRGGPRFLGRPRSDAPWLGNPAGCAPPLPVPLRLAGGALWPSGTLTPWAPGRTEVFGANSPRLTWSPAYTSPARFPYHRRKAGFRLAGLSLGRAGFEPAGRQTMFQLLVRIQPPHGPALPGRTNIVQYLRKRHLCRKRSDGKPPPSVPWGDVFETICDALKREDAPAPGQPTATFV